MQQNPHNIEGFYRENYSRLVSQMSRKMAGNKTAAEDVVQEAFMRATKAIHSYDPDRGKFSSWFNVILYNVLRDAQSEYKHSPEESVEELSVSSVLDGAEYATEDFSKEIRHKIYNAKNQKHKDILELFFVYGYTSKEIPYLLEDVSQSNVTTVVKRFKDRL